MRVTIYPAVFPYKISKGHYIAYIRLREQLSICEPARVTTDKVGLTIDTKKDRDEQI
jgi:hypothetical protein